MPYLFLRLLVALALWAGAGWAQGFVAEARAASPLLLTDNSEPWPLQDSSLQWLEPGRNATAAQAWAAPFEAAHMAHAAPLNVNNTLWIKLTLVRATGSTGRWTLNIPQPHLDHVVLFERHDGAWYPQTAGDKHAQRHWNVRGLYPEFELYLPPGQPTEVLLQIRNFKPLGIPLRMVPANLREGQRLAEGIGLGVMLGLILTLAAVSLMRYAEFRNVSDLGAALYSAMIAVTLAQFNGILNALLWSGALWADYASSVMPSLAIGVALLYGRHLYAFSNHYPWFDKLLGVLGVSALASVACYLFLDRTLADTVSGVVILLGTACSLLATAVNWKTGSPLGAWLLWTYTPQFALVIWMTLEAGGNLPAFWPLRYLLTLTVAASVPALVYALGRATHDRKEVVTRAEQLPTQDALTGLLTADAFQAHLTEAYERAITHREPLALVLVNIANLDHIRHNLGDPAAEQCLLRAVIKLHRVLRDVDPAARVGSARFALLLEGVSSRQMLTERLVKLVASGLIPLQGMPTEVTLQFQAACVLLHENPVEPAQSLNELAGVLAGISPRTRRPIRFLEPVPTQLSSLHSSLSG